MMNAPCADPVCFCAGLLFPCGSACYIRRKSLDGNMQHYKCCQGYYDCMCLKAGNMMEDSCPDACNVLEAFLCFSCSISATRMLVMDTRDIAPDPTDARLVRLSNTLQMLACLCDILAMIDDNFSEAAEVIDFIADVVFAIISSCMIAQVNHELKDQPRPFDPQRAANAPPRSGSKAMRQMQVTQP